MFAFSIAGLNFWSMASMCASVQKHMKFKYTFSSSMLQNNMSALKVHGSSML